MPLERFAGYADPGGDSDFHRSPRDSGIDRGRGDAGRVDELDRDGRTIAVAVGERGRRGFRYATRPVTIRFRGRVPLRNGFTDRRTFAGRDDARPDEGTGKDTNEDAGEDAVDNANAQAAQIAAAHARAGDAEAGRLTGVHRGAGSERRSARERRATTDPDGGSTDERPVGPARNRCARRQSRRH